MHQPVHVLTIGPSPDLLGGMSTVIGQMLRLNLAPKYTLSALPITLSSKTNESGSRRLARHFGQRMLLGKTLRCNPPAIAHVHTCSGFSFHRSAWDIAVARRHRCRTVLHMHGARFDEYFAGASRFEQRLVRATLQAADRVIALSGGWRESLLTIAPESRVRVIENAVDEKPAQNRGPARGPCRFLTLARMDAWKGIDDLLDACAILKRQSCFFELVLAGPEGTAGDAATLAAKIAGRNLENSVRYVGPVLGETKAKLLAESDVYVQPSHHEGLPISVLEAFACGLPVIATRVGAVPEVMEHEVHGMLVPSKNPVALAAAMSGLTIDPPRRIAMGNEGRRLAVSRFSLSRFREDLLELYDGLIRAPQRQVRPLVASRLRTKLTMACRSMGLER